MAMGASTSDGGRAWADVTALLERPETTLVCAPMVRYSKLAFRKLVRKYGADVVFTPMIIASSFADSSHCRDAEFTTDRDDTPMIVQFAAANGPDLARASEYIIPHSDGVDLNCGCPQRWAMAEGYGSKLIYSPERIADMVASVRRLPAPAHPFSVSVKIRIQDELDATVELCRQAEAAGASFLSVHARTPQMRHDPIREEAYGVLTDCVRIPIVANGDIFSLKEGLSLAERYGLSGLMSARGILHNPALFTGAEATPLECLRDWLDLSLGCGANFATFHHHCMFMLDRHLTKAEKKTFNRLQSIPAVLDYLGAKFGV